MQKRVRPGGGGTNVTLNNVENLSSQEGRVKGGGDLVGPLGLGQTPGSHGPCLVSCLLCT